MLYITQFREDIVLPALHGLQLYTKEFAELLVFTCAVESNGGTYIKQVGGDGAGIFNMNPRVFTDLWVNYIVRNPSHMNLLTMNFGVNRMPMPTELMTDLKLAAAICGLYYKWKKVTCLSMEPENLWELYTTHYATGSVEKELLFKAYGKFIKA